MDNFDYKKEADMFNNLGNIDGRSPSLEIVEAILHRDYCQMSPQQRAQTLQEMRKSRSSSWSELHNGADKVVAWKWFGTVVDTKCD
jgi:hypothetical protein